jgi:glycerophosphoryl diester phosphodiesterase
MRRIFLRYVLPALVIFAGGVFLLNTNLLAPTPTARPLLLAHRGLGQPFSREGLTGETCTAKQMLASGHQYIENTNASFQAAFDAGADIVEFDVQPGSPPASTTPRPSRAFRSISTASSGPTAST